MSDSRWLPISEAPEDGTRVLLYWPDAHRAIWIGRRSDPSNYWVNDNDGWPPAHQPSHFMPLPEPPE